MLLSIMIPTTPDRETMLYGLLSSLHEQIENCGVEKDVEILVETDNYELSVGAKRQRLLERAKGEWVVSIDSDDEVSHDYISSIMEALKSDPDVVGFKGFITTNGGDRENFTISKDLLYTSVSDAFGKKQYLRHSNHLCPIKREIALKIGYKDMTFAEDYDYAVRLKNSGLVKAECFIDKPLYHYKYISNKPKKIIK